MRSHFHGVIMDSQGVIMGQPRREAKANRSYALQVAAAVATPAQMSNVRCVRWLLLSLIISNVLIQGQAQNSVDPPSARIVSVNAMVLLQGHVELPLLEGSQQSECTLYMTAKVLAAGGQITGEAAHMRLSPNCSMHSTAAGAAGDQSARPTQLPPGQRYALLVPLPEGRQEKGQGMRGSAAQREGSAPHGEEPASQGAGPAPHGKDAASQGNDPASQTEDRPVGEDTPHSDQGSDLQAPPHPPQGKEGPGITAQAPSPVQDTSTGSTPLHGPGSIPEQQLLSPQMLVVQAVWACSSPLPSGQPPTSISGGGTKTLHASSWALPLHGYAANHDFSISRDLESLALPHTWTHPEPLPSHQPAAQPNTQQQLQQPAAGASSNATPPPTQPDAQQPNTQQHLQQPLGGASSTAAVHEVPDGPGEAEPGQLSHATMPHDTASGEQASQAGASLLMPAAEGQAADKPHTMSTASGSGGEGFGSGSSSSSSSIGSSSRGDGFDGRPQQSSVCLMHGGMGQTSSHVLCLSVGRHQLGSGLLLALSGLLDCGRTGHLSEGVGEGVGGQLHIACGWDNPMVWVAVCGAIAAMGLLIAKVVTLPFRFLVWLVMPRGASVRGAGGSGANHHEHPHGRHVGDGLDPASNTNHPSHATGAHAINPEAEAARQRVSGSLSARLRSSIGALGARLDMGAGVLRDSAAGAAAGLRRRFSIGNGDADMGADWGWGAAGGWARDEDGRLRRRSSIAALMRARGMGGEGGMEGVQEDEREGPEEDAGGHHATVAP